MHQNAVLFGAMLRVLGCHNCFWQIRAVQRSFLLTIPFNINSTVVAAALQGVVGVRSAGMPQAVKALCPDGNSGVKEARITDACGRTCTPLQRPFSTELWDRIEATVFKEIVQQPFLKNLVDGSLEENTFRFYIAQDSLYLKQYSRALAFVATKAPRQEWKEMFEIFAKEACAAELGMHQDLLSSISNVEEALPVGPHPNALLYTSYMLSTILAAPFHEGVASVLPCFMVYQRVGKFLKRQGSPHPVYQKWIDLYGGEEFDQVVRKVESMVDEMAKCLTLEERERMHHHMLMGSRMEWMFWDAAYSKQTWPV